MHARIQELLSIRDGEPVDAEARRHVGSCAACGAELRRLGDLQHALRRLPTHFPPAHTWNDIRARLAIPAPRQSRYAPALAAGGGMLACLVAFVWLAHRGGMIAPDVNRSSVAAQRTERAPSEAEIGPLVAHSQRLEALLRTLPPRPAAERAVTSATIDELQNRIQWLDLELAAANGADVSRVRHLWDARVQLLNSLVYVRYAESAGRPSSPMQLGVI